VGHKYRDGGGKTGTRGRREPRGGVVQVVGEENVGEGGRARRGVSLPLTIGIDVGLALVRIFIFL
jgi:hypothetical protein